jgi:transmembrane sensor
LDSTVNHIDELIGKYLSGEASISEAEEVKLWAGESDANQKYFEHYRIIFERASAIKTLTAFDEDAAWQKVKLKLQKKQDKVLPLHPSKTGEVFTTFNWSWRIAAGFIILLGVSFSLYKLIRPGYKATEVIATTHHAVGNKLPDGTNVFLNKQSKINYTYDKRKDARIVNLKGEAYFNIKHDKRKDFIITVEDVYIKDIGTAFNVKAYPELNTIEVVVNEGEVIFYTDEDSVYLYAGDKGVYDKLAKKFFKDKPATNELAYKTKIFTFNDQQLVNVIKDLNGVYNKKIILRGNFATCRLTVNFSNEDISEIATVIAETLNLNVRETNKEIIIEGTGCE